MTHQVPTMPRSLASVALCFIAGSLSAAEIKRVSNSNGLERAVALARPGSTILLHPGDYILDLNFRGVHGTAKESIIIAADNPAKPPRFIGKREPLHFNECSYLELENLIIEGASDNGLNMDDAGNPDKPTHHITLRNIVVRDIGPKGNHDAFKLSGVDDFLVENCTFERWGSGEGSAIDMVGCHRGTIAGCTFRKGGANAVQMKGGSSDITIRKCRFEDAGERAVSMGGFTENNFFRPRLKEMPEKGKYETKNITVEGCTFVGGEAAVAFVGVDGAIVRYNTIYRPEKFALRILQEKTGDGFLACRNGVFERNIVVFRSGSWVDGGVNIGPDTEPKTFKFAENLWYCEDQPEKSAPQLPAVEKDGVIGKNPFFKDPAKGDFGVGSDSPAREIGAHALPNKAK
jgi:hypothetical protein